MSAVVRLLKPVALPLLLITAGILGLALLPALPQASAASFTLFGRISSPAGWGFTSTTVTSPGPDLTVLPGETVTVSLTSGDGFLHNWGVDYNGNGVPDPGEPLSNNFAGSTSYTFTATTTPGTYTYWCYIHHGAMFGRFIVQPPPPPGPDFGVSSNPSSLTILQGSKANSTITVTSLNNFAGSITLLSSPSSPSGLTTSSFSRNPVMVPAGGTAKSNFTISVPSSMSPGSYSLTVTGSNSTTSRNTSVSVAVIAPDFTILSSPSSLNILQGSSGTSTITLTSVNGFSGTVSLTSTLSSSGPQVTFSPASVAVSSGGSISSTMSVSATSSGAYSTPVSQGSYTVTVTGTSGSLVHSATISLTVGSSSGAGGLPSPVIIGGGIAAAVAVVATIVYTLRRRTKTKT